MAKSQRDKGSRFERQIAKQLGEWWGCEFRRTPMSGGWGHAITCGDVVQMDGDRRFPFSVECKHQEDWTFDQFIADGKRSKFARFLQQGWKGADTMQMLPMVIVKRNGWKDPVVVLPANIHLGILPIAMMYFSTSEGRSQLVSCYKLSALLSVGPEQVEQALEK